MPTADVSVTDSAVEITSGLYDIDDGFKAKVAGDEFWRVVISPQGAINLGDGTEAPAPIPSPFGVVAYGNATTPDSPGGNTGTTPEDGVGPWVQIPLSSTPVYGSGVVTVVDGMIHYSELGLYEIGVQVITDGDVPVVAFDGRFPTAVNTSLGSGTFIAKKTVLAGPDSPDNELIFGTGTESTLLGAGVQIIRIA